MKRVLITGANSYVGTNVEKWLAKYPDKYHVDTISVKGDAWKEHDFSNYDVVFHVAGIVHRKERPELRTTYFQVNRDLTLEIAKRARNSGVSQFIFMSTMAVYGQEGAVGRELIITRDTPASPKSFYGHSKLEAETLLKELDCLDFKVVIIRAPMVYGPNCPGNYARVEQAAKLLPFFPMVENSRSMLHIDNLCEYVKQYIDRQVSGIFLPQDDDYVNTSLMVKEIAEGNGKSIHLSKVAGVLITIFGKRNPYVRKIFGNMVYEKHE